MYQITEEEIPQEVIDRYIPQNLKLKEKLIRKINEMYQFHAESYREAQKENYSFIIKLLESHLFHYC